MDSSSSKPTKTHHKKKQKHHQCSRSPLRDLNTTANSIEAPRGCLRFFLSHSSSNTKAPFIKGKALIETPTSAPNPSKAKNITPCLYQWQSGRKPTSKIASKRLNLSSGSPPGRSCTSVNDVNFTPLSKIATGSGLDFAAHKKVTIHDEKISNTSGSNNKTPPIQASVSPEIQTQCGGSALASKTSTPACYAAGYLVSGVTDKRKCRPRGILTVGDNNFLDFDMAKPIDSFGEDDDHHNSHENVGGVVDSNDSTLTVPLPAEASMHWLLSPCNEDDEDLKENSDNGSCGFRIRSPSLSLFGDGCTSNLCNDRNHTSSDKRSSISLLSPTVFPEFQVPLRPFNDNLNLVFVSSPNCTPSCKVAALEVEGKQDYDIDGEISPFSMDTLGSGNIIQTPQSDSSTDRCIGTSWLKTTSGQGHRLDSELDLVTESLQMMSLSSKGYESIWDPSNSSFQFDCLTSPSNSVDLSQFQKILDDQVSWMSASTLDNVSQSQMRISWREGLVSRMFEMDEFDSCRYLSDEEEDVNECHNNHQLKSCQNPELNDDAGNYETPKNGDLETEEKGDKRLPCQISCPCAESISIDGGDLAASGDSDWTLCYKNQLFKV
ncbi:hypothetical protein EZV62_001548 [Acer yangbiense]|uniref:Uncharacterized protein n=1 Tax=Acer yangbiense TaxID=1000413 RepID=A0A5C7IV51_9ROSI|nr:hypothetical protein EZV62_001548 [Acer yangbiense]